MFKSRNFLTALFALIVVFCSAQSINTEFGKNRVQYHDDFTDWWRYETQNFITYWYGKGRNIAQPTIQIAELDFVEIQRLIEHRINDKIEILVYLDITDMKQSNLGSEDSFVSETGQTKIVGNKIFVYFDGNHQNLRRQIKEGIAKVYLNSMFFGNTFQEIVQNAVLLSIPEWYKDGIVSYVGSNWDHEIEDELRDLLERSNRNYYDFHKLAEHHPRVAGHSLWYYLEQNYGKTTISNLLYLTRINRNVESAFLYVLGTSYENIIEEWINYYEQYFAKEDGVFETVPKTSILPIKNKRYRPISKLRLSPDGNQLIYITNHIGKAEVRLKSLDNKNETLLFKTGFANAFQSTDYNYPLVVWHPNGDEITIVYEHRDVIRLRKLHLPTMEYIEQDLPEGFQRVYNASFYKNDEYIFAASKNGFSNLFHYKAVPRQSIPLTSDFYDDIDAQFVNLKGNNGILFSSNRPDIFTSAEKIDTVLPLNNFDLFFLPFDGTVEENSMIQLTNTPFENERHSFLGNKDFIVYLSDLKGVVNRKLYNVNTNTTYFNSNKNRNIIFHHAVSNSDKYTCTYYIDGEYKVFVETPNWTKVIKPFITSFKKGKQGNEESNQGIGVLELPEEIEKPIEQIVIDEKYLFQSEFADPKLIEEIKEEDLLDELPGKNQIAVDLFKEDDSGDVQDKSQEGVIEFYPARAVASRLTFKMDYFTTKLDNEVLFEGLESFSGINAELENPPVGILLKANIKDLFEDYSVEGGVRIPTTFNGTEYFLVFDHKKKHIDKRFAIYRKSEGRRVDPFVFPSDKTKRITHLALFQLKYPFDTYRSVRATTTLRVDKFFYQSSDNISYNRPAVNEQRLGLKLEYVFDNTLDVDINIKHGTRYKFYIEAINRFNMNFRNGFNLDPSQAFTALIGADVRHYVPIGRHGVWASRFSAATSLGSEKMLFYLGGTDNWVFPSFNDMIPLNTEENFSFKSLTPNMRGFEYNIRNGTSYALLNTELRIPVFKMISKKRVKSSFLRNFQVLAFVDAGTAWYGLSPYSDENPLNTLVLENPPSVLLEINFFRDPLVLGYGLGLRTTLLGYFIRFDYAWGIETREILDPKLYFSIGTDF